MGTAQNIGQWDDFVADRYDPNRKPEDFRKFDDPAPAGVREFYRQNHANQTRDYVQEKKRQSASQNVSTRAGVTDWCRRSFGALC
jgi:inositol oxygenase